MSLWGFSGRATGVEFSSFSKRIAWPQGWNHASSTFLVGSLPLSLILMENGAMICTGRREWTKSQGTEQRSALLKDGVARVRGRRRDTLLRYQGHHAPVHLLIESALRCWRLSCLASVRPLAACKRHMWSSSRLLTLGCSPPEHQAYRRLGAL